MTGDWRQCGQRPCHEPSQSASSRSRHAEAHRTVIRCPSGSCRLLPNDVCTGGRPTQWRPRDWLCRSPRTGTGTGARCRQPAQMPPQLLLADVVLVGYRPLAPGECCGMILATRLSSTCRRFGWQVRRRENWRARPETWCVWSPGAGMWLVQRPSDWCQWCGCQTSSCRGSVLLQWTCNANGVVVVVKDTLMVWPWYCHAHALARMIWETRHTRLLRYCHAANV